MADRAGELRRVIREAEANGWTGCASFVVVRITEHLTSDTVLAAGWWDEPTYTRIETLDFSFPRGPGRVPFCQYHTNHAPWIGGSATVISYRRACTLLRQPLAQSDFHA